jgi:hypothetical protein
LDGRNTIYVLNPGKKQKFGISRKRMESNITSFRGYVVDETGSGSNPRAGFDVKFA